MRFFGGAGAGTARPATGPAAEAATRRRAGGTGLGNARGGSGPGRAELSEVGPTVFAVAIVGSESCVYREGGWLGFGGMAAASG